MTVLISGAYGFVGTNLSRYLAGRGVTCWALDVPRPAGGGPGGAGGDAYARRFTWDDLGRIPWGGVDAVVHLAGKAHDTKNTADPKSYFDVNVGLTERLIGAVGGAAGGADAPAAPRAGGRGIRFIFFSSVKACADTVGGVLTEDAEPDPKTPYGRSKLKAEGVLAGMRGAADIYVLRPAMIHGPGNKGNLNLLYSAVSKGIPWPLGAFENRRSFTSVANICAVVLALCEGRAAPGTYQVADDESLSTNEVVRALNRALGRKARIWRLPAGLVRFAARAGDLLRLPLNSERLKKLTESYVVSNGKIKRALGWEAMPVRAEEGLETTARAFGRLRGK